MKQLAIALALSIVCFTAQAAEASSSAGVDALGTGKFIDTIGINIHVNYTDGAYADVGKVGERLQWLGVKHVRDNTPGTSAPLSAYIHLAKLGFRYAFIIDDNFPRALELYRQINAAAPGSIAAIEGYNEINNWPVTYAGLSGQQAGLAGQKALYELVRSKPWFTN
ncbi:MAG TPA: calcium-binding protein, partial [Paraburkholderia sp.]|nr:calcium-binding protein [Paraburkholderia sp.]